MKKLKTLTPALSLMVLLCAQCIAGETGEKLFSTRESKIVFADQISPAVGKAWKKWQDSVIINDIDVEGARGVLLPGDMGKNELTSSSILEFFNADGKSEYYVKCVKVITGAVGNGMRLWQRGYSHDDIPFPQGSSCVYTLPPCNNVPVTIGSGRSLGDKAMTEEGLYNHMVYNAPADDENMLAVFRASARAIAVCFDRWKETCSIVDISAKGGIAPQPVPMGSGPGPVKGAKGNNGKLIGAYFDGKLMRDNMVESFKKLDS